MLMSGVTAGNVSTVIDVSKIDSGTTGSLNFSYSVWFNINDWTTGYGSPKILFQRLSSGTNLFTPKVYFDSVTNDLVVTVANQSGTDTCKVKNVPIQKWVNLIISVYGRSLDAYINGKLVNTCVLTGVPIVDKTQGIQITPSGGFNGWVTQFQFWASPMDPQTAWNIYKAGNGSSIFSGLFGSYGIKLSLLNNNIEQNAISI